MPIQVLDQNTINQIAAGEVVERPASVVKELMENAIDAGATAITAEIREGGIGFIRITDNGCGIKREELPLAFLRHSTSKIRSAEDLLTVSSLGFRGEALSSIAAVSQVELITKTGDSLTGCRYQIEGGQEKSLEEVGAPDGTTFISRNLFFNTPARRKFLKTAATEGAHVADLVEKIALSHPEISIRLIVNNQNKLHTSGNHNLKDIIYTIYGREITAELLPVSLETEMFQVSGFIGKPSIARGNRNFENYFINGRYIKSGLIARAIEDGYKSYMMQHKYPFTMLHFTVEPEYIDVNVHPSKMELRFKDGEFLYKTVCQMIQGALSGRELIPQVEITGRHEEKKEPGRSGAGNETSGKEASHRAPEPFEKKRMAAMGVLEERSSYGDRRAGTGSRTAMPSVGSGPSPARSGRPEGKTERPEEKPMGFPEQPVRQTEPSVRAAGPQGRGPEQAPSRPMEQPVPPEEAPSRPMEQPVPPAGEPSRQAQPPARQHKPEDHRTESPSQAEGQMEMFDGRLLSEKARSRHRLIGQVFDTYWLVEYNGSLYIIDQHAAHEKVLFEKTFRSLKSREYTSQFISPPIILTLSMQEEELLKKHMDVFARVGFEIEPFGGSEYAVRAVPDNLFSLAKKELLMEMLDGLSEDSGAAGPEAVYDRIASMSCKAAVKGNSRLSEQEADRLIDELLGLENPYACPHGRPTIISISKYEMEKKFKRIV